MIEGTVNSRREAVVDLRVQGPDGRALEIEAVVDTGYAGFLTLPAEAVSELALPYDHMDWGILANDTVVDFDVHQATVLWDGQRRDIQVDVAGSTPLIGMLLLDEYRLTVDVKVGGRVVIEAAPVC